MAWKTGTVSTFCNKLITAAETLATGAPPQTVFTGLQLGKPPVFINAVQVRYTIGATQYTATSDSSGNFTGTNLTSGTVNEAGVIALTFSTAPDVGTPIQAIQYTTKGLEQVLLDWCCGTKYAPTIGTGDGSTQTFPFTLANTPIAKGNARIKFKIGTTEYQVFDNGEGAWVHPQITTSSINYNTGASSITFVAPITNLYAMVLTYCVGQNAGEEGRDWLLLHHRNSQNNLGADAFSGLLLKECWLKNSGSTYKEAVYVGIREAQYIAGNFWNWNINADYALGNPPADDAHWNWNSYKTTKTTYDATYKHYSGHPAMALRDDVLTYWFFANKNRVIVIARVTGSVYVSCYMGIGLRFSSPDRFPYPVLAMGSISGNLNYANTSTTHTFIIDSFGASALWCYDKDGLFISSANRRDLGPRTLDFFDLGSATGTAGKTVLFPVFLRSWDGASVYSLLSQMEGVYMVLSDEVESEDIIQVSGQDYLVFQNIHRVAYKDYLAIKKI